MGKLTEHLVEFEERLGVGLEQVLKRDVVPAWCDHRPLRTALRGGVMAERGRGRVGSALCMVETSYAISRPSFVRPGARSCTVCSVVGNT